MSVLARLALAGAVAAAACGSGATAPVGVRLGSDACAGCRMIIVSSATAAEVVAPGEEPLVFDDLGCLRDYLAGRGLADDAVVWVADHRTHAWVEAHRALFTRARSVDTPMASALVAHADARSRDADPAAAGGTPVAPAAILGAALRSTSR